MGIITSESWVIKHKKELIIKHKETKKRSFFSWYKDNKRLKSRHKAYRMETKHSRMETKHSRMEIFVDFVKAALAASVSSTADKTLSLCSFVFKKTLWLRDSVFRI